MHAIENALLMHLYQSINESNIMIIHPDRTWDLNDFANNWNDTYRFSKSIYLPQYRISKYFIEFQSILRDTLLRHH